MAALIFFNKMRWDSNVSLDLFDLSNRNIILRNIQYQKSTERERERERERRAAPVERVRMDGLD